MNRRMLLLVALAIPVAAGVLWSAATLVAVNVSLVRVEGDLTDAESRQVRAVVATELEAPGLCTVADVVAAVEGLGWVRQVRVRKQWPDALQVVVRRETLAARWGANAWLTTGGVVAPGPKDPDAAALASLPVFVTALADGPQAMGVYNLLNEPAQAEGLRITRLDQDEVGRWTVGFANGIQLMLGAVDLNDRLQRFTTVYRAELRRPSVAVERVDARYDNGVAVRWMDPKAAPLASDDSYLVAASVAPRATTDD